MSLILTSGDTKPAGKGAKDDDAEGEGEGWGGDDDDLDLGDVEVDETPAQEAAG